MFQNEKTAIEQVCVEILYGPRSKDQNYLMRINILYLFHDK